MLTLALTNRPQEILKWNKDEAEYYRGLARLSALLHDLGHAPFSHAGEELFPIAGQEQKLTHEDYTFGIITETELSQYIDNCYGPGAARKVAEIATGRAKTREMAFLSELLTGDFGADRIDYLIRDSYHLGVQYGRFDVPRLLNTIHVRLNEEKQGPELALESGGLHTVEGFLLARYFMFLDVYFHKTRRILDQHLVDFLRENLSGAYYPVDLEEYLKWDDARVLELLKEKEGTQTAQRLLARKHLRMAFETEDHPEPASLVMFDWLREKLEGSYQPHQIYCDEAERSPYSFDRPPIFVLHRGDYKPLTKMSALVRQLKKIKKCRVYAEENLRPEIEKICNKFWDEKKKRGS